MSKPHLLRNLSLNEISLVDKGANPGAQVLLFKRETSKEHDMPDDATKGLTPEQLETLEKATELVQANEDLTKSLDAMTKERDFAKDELTKVNARLIKLEKASAEGGDDKDDITKDLPEAVRKQLDAAETESAELKKRIEKMEEDTLTGIYVEKAKLLKNLTQKPDDFGPILMRVSLNKVTPEDVVAMETVLTAANQAVTKLHVSSGTDLPGDNLDSAIAKLEKHAAVLIEADAGLTEAAAFAKATENHPALYEQYLSERQ